MPAPFLTLKHLNDPDNWEPALAYPFPPNPESELLLKTRDRILEFLRFVTDELVRDDPIAACEIHVAATRLAKIVALLPAAEKADVERSLQIAATFRTTTRAKSLRGFRRLETHPLEDEDRQRVKNNRSEDLEAR